MYALTHKTTYVSLALGYHRSEVAFKYLISRVGYNIEPMRARSQILDGLKYSAEWQDKQSQKLAVEAFGTKEKSCLYRD